MSETTRITATVVLDVHPRKGQSPTEAATEFHAVFKEYLESTEHPFRHDYGASIEDIKAAETDPNTQPTWGGYEGPYVTHVAVTGAERQT